MTPEALAGCDERETTLTHARRGVQALGCFWKALQTFVAGDPAPQGPLTDVPTCGILHQSQEDSARRRVLATPGPAVPVPSMPLGETIND